MAAASSMDLRTRVLKDADAGLTSKELAARYRGCPCGMCASTSFSMSAA